MAVTYGFYNAVNADRKYNATQMSSLFDGLIEDGVYLSQGDAFTVTQNTVPDLHVQVGEGRAWFKHTWTLNDAHILLDIETPDILYPRIDSVILEINRSDAVRANSIRIIKGTPAASPVEPTMQHTSTLDQYRLANIAVAANDTEIINANITYKVGTAETPFVAGVLASFDVEAFLTDLQNQFDDTWLPARQAEFDAWLVAREAELEAEFDAWLLTLGGKIPLTNHTDFWVRLDGNDANDGSANDSAHAWRSIGHAILVVASTYDLQNFMATIRLGQTGTYNETVTLMPYTASLGGYIRILGDGMDPHQTILSSSGIRGEDVGHYSIGNFLIQAASNSDLFYAKGNTFIEASAILGNAGTGAHYHAADGAKISANGDVNGSAKYHFRAHHGGRIYFNWAVDFHYTNFVCDTFALCQYGGMIIKNVAGAPPYYYGIHVGGSSTGKRYESRYNAIIDTMSYDGNPGGANFFPGNAAGTTSDGGLYI